VHCQLTLKEGIGDLGSIAVIMHSFLAHCGLQVSGRWTPQVVEAGPSPVQVLMELAPLLPTPAAD
jgi:hypothetical protein